jgi:hypothetical protein
MQDMIGRMRATIGYILSDKSHNTAELSVTGHLTLVANIGAHPSSTVLALHYFFPLFSLTAAEALFFPLLL